MVWSDRDAGNGAPDRPLLRHWLDRVGVFEHLGAAASRWLDLLAIIIWLLVVVSALRVVKAVKFLNDEEAREATATSALG